MTVRNYVEMGWDCPPMREQFPSLSEKDAEMFDEDNKSIVRLRIRGLLSDAEHKKVIKRYTSSVYKALNK